MNDGITWGCRWRLEKYADGDAPSPYEVIDGEGNLLMIGGASALWQRLIGTAVDAFDNTNAHIGVGDSPLAVVNDQTDLQATTNKVRVGMEASYPEHVDSTSDPAAMSIIFRSEFDATTGNFAWNEWGIFNDASTGVMLNRKVISLGTKTNPEVWTFTVTISLQ